MENTNAKLTLNKLVDSQWIIYNKLIDNNTPLEDRQKESKIVAVANTTAKNIINACDIILRGEKLINTYDITESKVKELIG